MSEDKEKKLNEYIDFMNFARLRKQILTDLMANLDQRNLFLKKHPRDKIIKALLTPDLPWAGKMLREISHFFYAVSPHYRRTISMLANIILNNYVLRSVGSLEEVDDTQFFKDYAKLARLAKKWRFKAEIPKILTTCLLDGIFYGVEYEASDSYMIKPLMYKYCRLHSVENGVYKFEFDLDYFNAKNLVFLEDYGDEFVKAYYAYKGNEKLDIKGDKTKRWFEPKNQICVKFDEEEWWCIPPFVGIFKAIIDLDTYEDIKKDAAMLDNYKLIHYKIPTDTDGVPKLSFEQATKYYNMTAQVVPEGIGVVMSPFTLETVNLKETGDTEKDYTKEATRQLFNNMGFAPVLFGITESATSGAMELAIRPVEAMMMKIIRQIQKIYNLKIQKLKLSNLFEVDFLNQSIFNQTDVQNAYQKAGMYGLPDKLYYRASLGLEPIDDLNMSFLENKILGCGLDIYNRPLISSNTLSGGEVSTDEGGRPASENPTENTEKNADNNADYK